MNRETIKTFILAVLVGLSFLLSYILWSYQPKYEMFYDASYISEVDIGGKERGKNELLRPSHIIFHQDLSGEEPELLGFRRPSDEYILYKEITTWPLGDFNVTDMPAEGHVPSEGAYLEIIFPNAIPAQLIDSLFSIDEEVELPNWSFDRAYILKADDSQLKIKINSIDRREQLEANIEKAGAFQSLSRYNANHPHLQTYVDASFHEQPIYIPETVENMTKKTLVANRIEPELLIDALFSNPSLVKPNQEEAFFTDGQRGMRIFQGGRYLEFIHPIETNDERLDPIGLVDMSIDHINSHKGWNNEYHFESLNITEGKIEYRLHYDGVPVYDFNNLSVIEQIWREQELYQYRRSLITAGHLLNTTEVPLRNSDEVIRTLEELEDYDVEHITDIQLGYNLTYMDEVHSLTLEPAWFMHYENNWMRIPFIDDENERVRGD